MVVRTARNDIDSPFAKLVCKHGGILNDLLLILLELIGQSLTESNSLGGDNVHKRTALSSGENSLVNLLCKLLLAKDHSASRTSECFMSCCCDDIRIRHG